AAGLTYAGRQENLKFKDIIPNALRVTLTFTIALALMAFLFPDEKLQEKIKHTKKSIAERLVKSKPSVASSGHGGLSQKTRAGLEKNGTGAGNLTPSQMPSYSRSPNSSSKESSNGLESAERQGRNSLGMANSGGSEKNIADGSWE